MNDIIRLSRKIDAGDFPSAVYLGAEKGEIVYQTRWIPLLSLKEFGELDTIYDLAV